ncbi:HEAT repeat domain-containing protein [Oscillatoriales cyanobacterium LEGE 11467]|uniref:HEAT repeat domain-containing protein n=1 Tax=Zarconia navalis LEGE 11467 TaxID=1828826 RepID=A0A928VSY3_9CYAN|nr:HEAT repeat domain-containing protein [Zarconia navalis]MBE9039799.1 HEAT repeat domain-containing protein [Zarconia navalis LEGE 11467]
MTFELATAGKIIAPLAGKVAPCIFDKVRSQINPNEIEKALKVGIKKAQQQEATLEISQQLFYRCSPDYIETFLEKFLKESADELQKPLNNQGEPDVKYLVELFKRLADEDKHINLEGCDRRIEPWLEEFVRGYFQETKAYLRMRVAREDYLQQLANYYDDVKFAGIRVAGQETDKSEKLVNIFVMPEVEEEKRQDTMSFPIVDSDKNWLKASVRELQQIEQKISSESIPDRQSELLREQRFLAQRERSGRQFSAAQLLSQTKAENVVILGEPGAGKTTLLSYFAVVLAEPDSVQTPEQQAIASLQSQDYLPILIRIRDWARNLDRNLLEYLRYFAENTLHTKTLPESFFDRWLEAGRALILLDGLDEVTQEAQRYEVVRRIENFLGRYPSNGNRAIVTSRPAGYKRDFFRTEAFPHYWLQPFGDDRIETFIHAWYDSRIADSAEAQRRQQSLQNALNRNDRIKNLARNPLLLTIIALIHRYEAHLPKQRHKLYDRAVETLLVNWDAYKSWEGDGDTKNHLCQHLEPDDWRRLMAQVAYWIHTCGSTEDEAGGTVIDKDELIDFLAEAIRGLKSIERYQAKAEAKRFLGFVRERTGLLNEQGQDCYAFVHKTFQEYLTAEEIDYQADNEGEFDIVLNCIGDRLHDSHWREVLLLLIAQQKPKKAAKAIRRVLERGSKYEEWLHRDLLFAGWCLAEDIKGLKGADAGLCDEVSQRLAALDAEDEKKVGRRVREQVFEILCSLEETAFEKEALALLKEAEIEEERLLKYRSVLGERNAVVEIYIERLADEDSWVRLRAASALGGLKVASDGVVDALVQSLKDENSWVRGNAAWALGGLKVASDGVVDALVQSLKDENSSVRSGAASALGGLKMVSDGVVDALVQSL